jgi:hypothetical protein
VSEPVPVQNVECRSEAAYAERPLAFTWQGRRQEVAEVISNWRTPAGKAFRVIAESGAVFDLYYDEHSDKWQIAEK